MRRVRIAIEYDMDDTDKPLSLELSDWLCGNVTVQDLFGEDGHTIYDSEDSIRIEEI